MSSDIETIATLENGNSHDADPNGTITSTLSHGDNNASDPGFGAVAAGVEELITIAQERMGISSHGGKEKPKSVTKLTYSLAFQLTAHVETEWVVVEGFTLCGIRLNLEAEMSSNNDPSMRIMLSANGTIGDIEFLVSAEIPYLQNNVPIDIIFRLSLKSQARPDDIWSGVEAISGRKKGTRPSQMVHSSVKAEAEQMLWAADIALAFVKPVIGSFSFKFFVFMFGGSINYTLPVDYPKIELVDGSFTFSVTKKQASPYDEAVWCVDAKLAGHAQVGGALLGASARFIKTTGEDIAVELSIWNEPPEVSLDRGLISAEDFYGNLLEHPGSGSHTASEALILLPPHKGLDALRRDLAVPSVMFTLNVNFGSKGLNELMFTVYARQITKFQAEFLGDWVIRELMLHIDLDPQRKQRLCLLTGTLEIDCWRFSAELKYQGNEKKGSLSIRGLLDESTEGNFSLLELARQPALNQSDKQGEFTEGGIDNYVKGNSLPSESGVSLEDATGYGAPAYLSFDLRCSYIKGEEKIDGTQADGEKDVANGAKPENALTITKQKTKVPSGYKIDSVVFQAHYGTTWHLIPDHIILKEVGAALAVEKPTTKDRSIAGYVYGQWHIHNFVLWTYIVGESNRDASTITLGLNIKNKTKNSAGEEGTIAAVLADPGFAGSVGMPELHLHRDIIAKPQSQELATGLKLDGHLQIKLVKLKGESSNDPATSLNEGAKKKQEWQFKQIMARLNIEADFVLFEKRVLAGAFIDLRITDPMQKDKRLITAHLLGYLETDTLCIMIAAVIKTKNAAPAMAVNAPPSPEDQSAVTEAKKDLAERNTTPTEPEEDTEDIHFQALLEYSPDGNQLQGDQASKKSKPDVASILGALSPTNQINRSEDSNSIPPGLGISIDSFAKSIKFELDIHVGKRAKEDQRTIKSLLFSVSAASSWSIVDDVLVLKDAGLKLRILQDGKNNRKVFIAYGTLELLKVNATTTAAILYSSGVLSVGMVVSMPLTKLLGGLTKEASLPSSAMEVPALLEDHEKAAAPAIVASVTAEIKDKKFRSYAVVVRSVGQIAIAGTFSVDECIISMTKEAPDGKLILFDRKTLYLQGRLNWGPPESRMSLSASALFTTQEQRKIIIVTVAFNKAPGAMLTDFLGADAPSKDARPTLPGSTGFDGWDNQSFDVSKYEGSGKTPTPTTSEEAENLHMAAQVVFEQLEKDQGRRLSTIAFVLRQKKDWRWDVIPGWFWFSNLTFKLQYDVPKKELSLVLETKLNFKRRTKSVTVRQVSLGSGNGDEDDAVLPPTVDDSTDITLTATMGELRLEFPMSKLGDCNSTDLIYCLSAGYLDVPRAFGIPMFPRVEATLSWKENKADVRGYLTDKGKHWEFNGFFGKILRMEDPHLKATVPFGKGAKAAGSIKGEAVLISTIRAKIEFVLPKGPLLINGIDVEMVWKAVKYLWELAQKLWKGVKTLFEIFEAIGSFISSVVAAGEGILTVAGIIGGLLLGGPIWSALKKKILDAIGDLFASDEDKKTAQDGARQGMKHHEEEKVSKPDPKELHDDPSKPVTTRNPETGEPTTTTIEGLEITGTGSASGRPGEAVDLLVICRPPKIAEQPTKQKRKRFVVSWYIDEKLVSQKVALEGFPVRCVYRRPSTECQYSLRVTAVEGAVPLAAGLPMAPGALEKKLTLSTKASRSACISEKNCQVTLPPNITAGVPFSATLVLADIHGNVIDSYDDRDLLIHRIDENTSLIPKILARKNGYILNFPPLSRGKHVYVAQVDGREIGQLEIQAASVFNPATVSMRGLGLCNGGISESCSIFIRCRDYSGEIMDNVAISVIETVKSKQTVIDVIHCPDQGGVYKASYSRPESYGKYELSININGQPVGESPYKLVAHDFVDLERTKIHIDDLQPTADVQTAVVEIFDYMGSRWRLSNAAFAGAKLEVTPTSSPSSPGDNSAQPPASVSILFDALTDNEDGTYSVPVKLTRETPYTARLVLPDGRATSKVPVTVPDQTLADVLYATGNGLQTGNEGTSSMINILGFDKKGDPVIIDDAQVSVSIAATQAVAVKIQDGKAYYLRPPSANSLEGAQASDTVEVQAAVSYRGREAYGSPFRMLSVPYAFDVEPVSFVVIVQTVNQGDSKGSGIAGQFWIALLDNYGTHMRAETEITVRVLAEGQALEAVFKPAATYEVQLKEGHRLDVALLEVEWSGKTLQRHTGDFEVVKEPGQERDRIVLRE